MPKHKAAIFDLDGTLYDTREMIFYQWERVSEEFTGRKMPRTEISSHIHGPFRAIVARVLDTDDQTLVDTALVRMIELRDESLKFFRLYEDTVSMLKVLQQAGYRLGAYTLSDVVARRLLHEHGLHVYITSMVTAEDVTQHKPHPEGLLYVLNELGVEPRDAVMIGDMPSDIELGKNAGVAETIGISHGFGTRESLESAGADAIVDSLPKLQAYLIQR